MSDEEECILQTEDGQMLTAEYKDGQLQIVDVSPLTSFDKENDSDTLPEVTSGESTKYLQILDDSNNLVQFDLLSVVKCSNDEGEYQVVSSTSEDGETTLTCVLASDDAEENENQDSYVVVNTEEGQDPLVFLQSSLQQINTQENLKKGDTEKTPLTPTKILEKARALQKARAQLQAENATRSCVRGRKRKSDLPPPLELLSSPNFKLYLYSCKMCNFKCNAVKEMSKHKAVEHGSGKPRGGRSAALQCARCPYRGNVHSQLMKHVQEVHLAEEGDDDSSGELRLDCDDIADADVLVCGACGFESSDREVFRKHIENDHGVNVTLKKSVFYVSN